MSTFAFKFNLRRYSLGAALPDADPPLAHVADFVRQARAYTRPLFGST